MTARRRAYDALWAIELGRGFGKEVLDEPAGDAGLDRRDAALARELVYGVVRHRRTLKHLLRPYSDVALEKVNPKVLLLLLLGYYQLLFLEKVPAHAAVAETVELARGKKSKGFVNAVLRAAARGIVERGLAAPPAGVPSTRVLAVRPGSHVVLASPGLPDLATDPVRALAIRHSYPDELVKRWLAQHGLETTEGILEAGNEPPPLFLRANPRRTDRERLRALLAEAGVDAAPIETPQGLRVVGHLNPAELAAFRDGLFTIQDETAQRAVLALDPRPGERVLDLCAAPGGKATQIAELMDDRGLILAVDVAPERLALVTEGARRLGLASIRPHATDALASAALPEGPFDRALADVPCSNTGVLRRRVEARWRFPGKDELESLARRQHDLLLAAARAVRPGGLVVYSTCSLEPEEDRGVVDRFLAGNPGFALEGEDLRLPRRGGGDGGYIARLRRKE